MTNDCVWYKGERQGTVCQMLELFLSLSSCEAGVGACCRLSPKVGQNGMGNAQPGTDLVQAHQQCQGKPPGDLNLQWCVPLVRSASSGVDGAENMTLQAVLEDWLGRAAPDTWDQWQLKLSLEHMCEVKPTLDIQVRLSEWKPWQSRVSKMQDLCWFQTQCSIQGSNAASFGRLCRWHPPPPPHFN